MHPRPTNPDAPLPALDPGDVGRYVADLAPHTARLLAGVDAAGLGDLLARGTALTRPILLLDVSQPGTAATLVRSAIRQIGRAVAALWPFGWGGEDFSEARDDDLTRAHLPIRFARLAERIPGLSPTWALTAALDLVRGRPPCRPDAVPDLCWAQLVLALSPAGLVVALPLPDGNAAAAVGAIEWLAARADVAVLALASDVPAPAGPCGRILYGARRVAAPRPAVPERAEAAPLLLALPQAEGRPHPQSAAELRLHRLIRADAELSTLFAFNRTIPDLARLQARVDLVWMAGRVIVEIDGAEHRTAARYRADRHRDYELLCAGYRVMRLTNEEVAEDAALVVEKIRDVVRLYRSEGS